MDQNDDPYTCNCAGINFACARQLSEKENAHMPRALWKGAITFGLVHIPVALYPAASHDELDFDWLDRRDMRR